MNSLYRSVLLSLLIMASACSFSVEKSIPEKKNYKNSTSEQSAAMIAELRAFKIVRSPDCASDQDLSKDLSLFLASCHVNEDDTDFDVDFHGNCFAQVSSKIAALGNKRCQNKFITASEPILTNLVLIQFEPKWDGKFKVVGQTGTSGSGFGTHFKWMSGWKVMGYPVNPLFLDSQIT
jgi:hypothetical protein